MPGKYIPPTVVDVKDERAAFFTIEWIEERFVTKTRRDFMPSWWDDLSFEEQDEITDAHGISRDAYNCTGFYCKRCGQKVSGLTDHCVNIHGDDIFNFVAAPRK